MIDEQGTVNKWRFEKIFSCCRFNFLPFSAFDQHRNIYLPFSLPSVIKYKMKGKIQTEQMLKRLMSPARKAMPVPCSLFVDLMMVICAAAAAVEKKAALSSVKTLKKEIQLFSGRAVTRTMDESEQHGTIFECRRRHPYLSGNALGDRAQRTSGNIFIFLDCSLLESKLMLPPALHSLSLLPPREWMS